MSWDLLVAYGKQTKDAAKLRWTKLVSRYCQRARIRRKAKLRSKAI
jgi:hypothetical protein